jgi:hypothetical protein
MREIAMPRPPRRSLLLQLDLFQEDTLPPGAPTWTALPDQTRRALTGLVTRMLIAHAGLPATAPEEGDNDL